MLEVEGPRLPLLPDAELEARGYPASSPDFMRVFGHANEAFDRWMSWYREIIGDGAVDSRLKEIVRLRVAQLNECDFWQAARIPLSGGETLDEDTVAKIGRWSDADFTPREQAALGYAERLFIDHTHIDREMFDALHDHFTTEQIVELGWAIASYMAFGRLIHAFGLRPD